jgi:hypothetical protein
VFHFLFSFSYWLGAWVSSRILVVAELHFFYQLFLGNHHNCRDAQKVLGSRTCSFHFVDSSTRLFPSVLAASRGMLSRSHRWAIPSLYFDRNKGKLADYKQRVVRKNGFTHVDRSCSGEADFLLRAIPHLGRARPWRICSMRARVQRNLRVFSLAFRAPSAREEFRRRMPQPFWALVVCVQSA